ncbi:MAG: NUDIX hydrolase [Anaerolineae bacterium]
MRPEDQRGSGERYTVVARTLVFLTRDDKVLLLRGAPTKPLWAGKYNGIGGHLEPGESPYASAMRELAEETGLTVARLELRGVVHITLPRPPGIVLFVFVGTDGGNVAGTDELKASEEGTPVWVKRARLASLPLVEDLPELLPRVLKPGPTVFAHYTVSDQGLEVRFDPAEPVAR